MVYFNWWPFPQSQIKKNPNYICNKDANAFLVFRARKVLAAGNFHSPRRSATKNVFCQVLQDVWMWRNSQLIHSVSMARWSCWGLCCPWFPLEKGNPWQEGGFSSPSRHWDFTQVARGLQGLLGACALVWKMLLSSCCRMSCPSCRAVGMARRGACRSLGSGSPQFFVSHRALDWRSRKQFSSSMKQWFLLLLPAALRASLGIKGEGILVPCRPSIKTPGGSRSGEEGAECFPVSHHTQDCVQLWLSKGSSFAPSLEEAGGCLSCTDPPGCNCSPKASAMCHIHLGTWKGMKRNKDQPRVCGKLCQSWVHFAALGLLALWREQGQSFPAGCIFLPKVENRRETHQNYLRSIFYF